MSPLVPTEPLLKASTPLLQPAEGFEQASRPWPPHLAAIRTRILKGIGNAPGLGYRNGEVWEARIFATKPERKPLWSLLRPPSPLFVHFDTSRHCGTLYYDNIDQSDAIDAVPGVNNYEGRVGSPSLQTIVLFVPAAQTTGTLGSKIRIDLSTRVAGELIKLGRFEFDPQTKSRFFLWTFDNSPPAPPPATDS